jgi:hypothetical protein
MGEHKNPDKAPFFHFTVNQDTTRTFVSPDLLDSNSDFPEQMHAGVVWAYNLVWMIVQDVVKPCIYWELNARAANQTPFLKHLKAVVHPHGALHQH